MVKQFSVTSISFVKGLSRDPNTDLINILIFLRPLKNSFITLYIWLERWWDKAGTVFCDCLSKFWKYLHNYLIHCFGCFRIFQRQHQNWTKRFCKYAFEFWKSLKKIGDETWQITFTIFEGIYKLGWRKNILRLRNGGDLLFGT